MTGHVRVLNYHLKRYDSDLYAEATEGNILVYRKYKSYRHLKVGKDNLYVLSTDPQFVKDFPRSSGIEPILQKIQEMDWWNKQNAFEEMRKNNERVDDLKQRRARNNFRAMAADVRRDFAKATSDINTSTISKIDNRRKKDGSRK